MRRANRIADGTLGPVGSINGSVGSGATDGTELGAVLMGRWRRFIAVIGGGTCPVGSAVILMIDRPVEAKGGSGPSQPGTFP